MSELSDEILEILEAEAHAALTAGWAEVRVEEAEIGLTLFLEPMKLTAAPLEVYFDSDELLVCSPGRNNMVCEFYSEDPEEIKLQVRALTLAVVQGTYSEEVKEGSIQLKGEWPGPDGTMQRAVRDVLSISVPGPSGWRSVSYEPY
jgi:hypothetical protein